MVFKRILGALIGFWQDFSPRAARLLYGCEWGLGLIMVLGPEGSFKGLCGVYCKAVLEA